jgi:tetratricopeptide (TPR) repeat protein
LITFIIPKDKNNMKKLIIILFITISLDCDKLLGQGSDAKLFNKIDSAFNAQDYDLILASKNEILNHANQYSDSISAELLYYLGDSFLAYDSLNLALQVMEKELETRKKISNHDPVMIADIQFNLGYYLQLNNDYEKSIQYFFEASELYKSNLGTDNPAFAESKIELAKNYGVLGEHQKSLNILEDLMKNNFVKQNYRYVINKELGMAYFDMGYYSKSEKILTENLEFTKESFGKESIEYAEH